MTATDTSALLTLISPAKTLDYDSPIKLKETTTPRFLDDSQALIETLRPMTAKRVGKLMNLSEKLSALNVARYANWNPEFTEENSRQSILAFKGDVYIGLDAQTLGKRDLTFAQKNLRILSGLYGVLRPFDLMQPYRLEMGTSLKNGRGKNLYEFWGSRITESLNQELRAQKSRILVNLASKEYFGAVKTQELDAELVTPTFLDQKNGEYKIISFFAKKARGSMARFIIEERLSSKPGILQFDRDGYQFDPSRSTPLNPVFTREEQSQVN